MNCHDFAYTGLKSKLLEKMADDLPGSPKFYSLYIVNGTTAVRS